MRRFGWALILPLLAACGGSEPPVTVDKALDYLRERLEPADLRSPMLGEFYLLTLLEAPGARSDPLAVRALAIRLEIEPATTFAAAVRAMALAGFDAKKYRTQLEELAEQLQQTQSRDGGWAYDIVLGDPPEFSSRNCVAHMAALGLEACWSAGVDVSEETVLRARRFWLEEQNEDGGWGCCGAKFSCGSMTSGILLALLHYDRRLGKDPKEDTMIRRGLDWLETNIDYKTNPGLPGRWHLYYLLNLLLLEAGLPEELLPETRWSAGVREAIQRFDPSDASCCGDFDPKVDLAFLGLIGVWLDRLG
jgi:hypothetical protein